MVAAPGVVAVHLLIKVNVPYMFSIALLRVLGLAAPGTLLRVL